MDKSPKKMEIKVRKWDEIAAWWETKRIKYNFILAAAILLSFLISYVSIPLIYVIIVVILNLGYLLFWGLDIVLTKTLKKNGIEKNYSKILFIVYIAISIVGVFGFAI